MRIHITNHSKGTKMAGIQSVSTSVLLNPICIKRRECGNSVCSKCYAQHLASYRKSLADCLAANYAALTETLITETDAIRCAFDTRYGRIESFGDVANVTHARNYIRIIRANPETNFGIWTKNAGIWKAAFDLEGKPENTTLVLSSPEINRVMDIPDFIRPYTDHVFTVWSKDQYTYAGTSSECAGLSCKSCLKCYRKVTSFEINERLR